MRKKNPERMKNMKIEAKLHTVHFPYPKTPPKRVRIYVPEHNEGEKMPVIYMTDGQSLELVISGAGTPHDWLGITVHPA